MDVAARLVGQQISVDIGRPVIVENRAGATGSIGLNAMLQAAPDGNTIVLGAINLLAEAPLVMKVPYDPLKDIVTIAKVADASRVLVTAASYPAKDFQSLIAHLKTRKDKSSFASFGTGSTFARISSSWASMSSYFNTSSGPLAHDSCTAARSGSQASSRCNKPSSTLHS